VPRVVWLQVSMAHELTYAHSQFLLQDKGVGVQRHGSLLVAPLARCVRQVDQACATPAVSPTAQRVKGSHH
jgi:hypothetical protein